MDNKSYFEYISKKPYHEQLRAFGDACDSMRRCSYENVREIQNGSGNDYYAREYQGQLERANTLFQSLQKFGYVWKGTTYSEDGEYSFYPNVEQAKEVFDLIEKTETTCLTYGVAEFDETANNVLTPMEVIGSYNL